MNKLAKEMRQHARQAIDGEGHWLMGVAGIVADNQDPDKQHRVRVIIPSIDENIVYDEWARQMVFCLGNGFGSAFIPPKGSEVVLFGQLGQKYNLFYASVYNEDMLIPVGYPDENNVGAKVPGNLKFIATLLATLQGQNVHVIAAQLARITGQNIESLAEQLHKITGETVESTANGNNNISAGVNISIQGGSIVSINSGAVTVDGNTIEVNGGEEVSVSGSTISIAGGGQINIQGGEVSIDGSDVMIRGRKVLAVGPDI